LPLPQLVDQACRDILLNALGLKKRHQKVVASGIHIDAARFVANRDRNGDAVKFPIPGRSSDSGTTVGLLVG
jgi:hypothetical protein